MHLFFEHLLCAKDSVQLTHQTSVVALVTRSLQNTWVEGRQVPECRGAHSGRNGEPHTISLPIFFLAVQLRLWVRKWTHQSTVMAHDGFPQGVVSRGFLVLNACELAGAAVQRAVGLSLADWAPTRDPKHRHTPAAPNAHRSPSPGDFGIG